MSRVPRTRAQRRYAVEVWLLLATFGVSLFMMGWLVGGATAAPQKCERVYPAPETFQGRHGIPLTVTPVGIGYARCILHNPCTLEQPCTMRRLPDAVRWPR